MGDVLFVFLWFAFCHEYAYVMSEEDVCVSLGRALPRAMCFEDFFG